MYNGIRVYLKGESQDLELNEYQAENFARYAEVASESASVGAIRPISDERRDNRASRYRAAAKEASTLKRFFARITEMNNEDVARLGAYLELMEHGRSWMSEVIEYLLNEVITEGVATSLEGNPRDILAHIAYDLYDWWDDIDSARSRMAKYPNLFPAPPHSSEPAAAEHIEEVPNAAPQCAPAKRRRARKTGKKVSHAA
jgi:hypothetical protein